MKRTSLFVLVVSGAILALVGVALAQVIKSPLELRPGERTAGQSTEIARAFLARLGHEVHVSAMVVRGNKSARNWSMSVSDESGRSQHYLSVRASTGHVSLYEYSARVDTMRTRKTPASGDRIRDLAAAERETGKVLDKILPSGHVMRRLPAAIESKPYRPNSRVVSKRVDGLIQGFPMVDVNYGAWIVLDALDGAVISYSANWIEPIPQVEYVAPKLTKAQAIAKVARQSDWTFDAELGWATKPGASRSRLCWRVEGEPGPNAANRKHSGISTYVDVATGLVFHD